MRGTQKFFSGTILVVVALGVALVPQLASSRSVSHLAQEATSEPVPAFHTTLPDGPLPATLSPSLFDDATAQNAYSLAARIKKVLYQQPCYCHCDRSQGHGSLLDCYVSKHAAVCGVCERENFYSYEQSRKGKTAAQIREGIEHGDWQQLDVTKYQSPLPAPAK
ncbi:MAG: CYCXC family (seleno)protein [Candidatus Acidiferrum sp.]|jgi:hypothetical protein